MQYQATPPPARMAFQAGSAPAPSSPWVYYADRSRTDSFFSAIATVTIHSSVHRAFSKTNLRTLTNPPLGCCGFRLSHLITFRFRSCWRRSLEVSARWVGGCGPTTGGFLFWCLIGYWCRSRIYERIVAAVP